MTIGDQDFNISRVGKRSTKCSFGIKIKRMSNISCDRNRRVTKNQKLQFLAFLDQKTRAVDILGY